MTRSNAGTKKTNRTQGDVTRAHRRVPSTSKETATETRKTKSAAPAIPLGNMENSLCTIRGYPSSDRWAIPIGGFDGDPLGWSGILSAALSFYL